MAAGKPEPRSKQKAISVGLQRAGIFKHGAAKHWYYLAPRNSDGVVTENGTAIVRHDYTAIAHIRNQLRRLYGDQLEIIHVQVTRNPPGDPAKGS